LKVLGVDYIDKSKIVISADENYYIGKDSFKVFFVHRARNLVEELRRIREGLFMFRTKANQKQEIL